MTFKQIQKFAVIKSNKNCEFIKEFISDVLAACQQYMRRRKVSFIIIIVKNLI